MYTIHNVIEQFTSKSQLLQYGEFYIDEYVIIQFKSNIKIEAGFYSRDLVSHLLNELNMPLRNTHIVFLPRRHIKPDTFSTYLKFIFDTFPEAEAN